MARAMIRLAVYLVVAVLAHAGAVAAQTFSSGSSGVHGSFPPLPTGYSQVPPGTQYMIWNMSTGLVRYCTAYDTATQPETCMTEIANAQIPGIPQGGLTTGVFEFSDVNLIHDTSTWLYIYLVGNANNSPLTVLSQNQIHFSNYVQLFASGMPGTNTASGLQTPVSLAGGRPGPGGFAGGASGFPGAVPADGDPGFGPSGGTGGFATGSCYSNPTTEGASATAQLPSFTPLLGGSGGGGGAGATTAACGVGHTNGAGGGGGGGAVVMVATTQINFEYVYLTLTGGNAGVATTCACYDGGAGAGGKLRLVAPKLLGTTYAQLNGGVIYFYYGYAGQAPGGFFRVEGDATQFNFYPSGQADGSISATPGSVVPSGTPTLRITQVGDLQVPAAPTGNTNTPDITFPTPPSGPVSVALAGSNIPPGTLAKVRVTPQVGSYQEVMSSALSGTAASTTASATVTIPPGFGAITASATFTCDGTICALLKPSDRANAVVEVVADNTGSRAWIRKADGTRIALPVN